MESGAELYGIAGGYPISPSGAGVGYRSRRNCSDVLAYADEADVGLTVVGSKNRSGDYRRLLGSVAERVARHSHRPVTVVKTPVDEA